MKGISFCPFIWSQNWGLPIYSRALVVLQLGQDLLRLQYVSILIVTQIYLQYDPKCSAFGSCVSNIWPFEYQTFFWLVIWLSMPGPRNYHALVALFHAPRLYDSILEHGASDMVDFTRNPHRVLYQSKHDCPPRSLNHSTHPSNLQTFPFKSPLSSFRLLTDLCTFHSFIAYRDHPFFPQ